MDAVTDTEARRNMRDHASRGDLAGALRWAKFVTPTAEEIAAQRESYVRAEMAMGETSAIAPPKNFQSRVEPWMAACFGPEISADRLERGDRLIEEVLELLQSGDYPRERVYALTEYVYGRPKGEPRQEAGGVMVTHAAYCLAHGIDMHEAAEAELARVWTKVEQIRAKQAAKPTGSALPVAAPWLNSLMAILALGPQSLSALAAVAVERKRQIDEEGWTPEHDDQHANGELAMAAACYAYEAGLPESERDFRNPSPDFWPWDEDWWKPSYRLRGLVKAYALLLSEMERLDRAAARGSGGDHG